MEEKISKIFKKKNDGALTRDESQEIESVFKDFIEVNCRKISQQLRNFISTQNGGYDNSDFYDTKEAINHISRRANSHTEDKKRKPLGNIEERFFQLYKTLIQEYLDIDYSEAHQIIGQEELMIKIDEQYNNFAFYTYNMSLLFQYLDNFHLEGLTDLVTQAFIQFRDYYWNKVESTKLFAAVKYFLIEKQRAQREQIPSAVKTIIQMYAKIGFEKKFKGIEISQTKGVLSIHNEDFSDCERYYKKKFGEQFKITLEKFYQEKILKWKQQTTPEYVEEVQKVLDQEDKWAIEYYKNSRVDIMFGLDQILIISIAHEIAEKQSSGVFHMLNEKQDINLYNIYKLYNRNDFVRKSCLKYINDNFYQYLNQEANAFISVIQSEINKPVEDKTKKNYHDLSKEFVENVIKLKEEAERLNSVVFKNDPEMQKSIDKSFKHFLNKFEKSTLFLADYADYILRQTNSYSEIQFEKKMQEIMDIFMYLNQRDDFFLKYQKFFSKRLLSSENQDHAAERQLLSKFKGEAGNNCVNNLEKMFKDLELSNVFMDECRNQLESAGNFEFKVKILNLNWGISPKEDDFIIQDNIPLEINVVAELFQQQFEQKNPTRYVQLLYNEGTADLILIGKNKKRYFLTCTSYQMLILFNLKKYDEGLTYKDLQEACGINRADFDFNLHFLTLNKACTRTNPDLKKKIKDTEIIGLNRQFENKQLKVKVLPKGKAKQNKADKEQDQNAKKEREKLESQRRNVVDAKIVMVMKQNRERVHNELVSDVIKLINLFTVDPRMIKKQIESLIERDYIKRSDSDRNTYLYIP